jgi:hypothetical protein
MFTISVLWAGYSSTSNDPGLKYLAQVLQKHWFINGYSATANIDGNTQFYAFYTGKYIGVSFDCGLGNYQFWDDWNTGYYGAPQKWCDYCAGEYRGTSGPGWTFIGWEVDGTVYEQCAQFVWEWTKSKQANGMFAFDMTANFDCGSDGVIGDGEATVKYTGESNTLEKVPLNITATCTPNPGKMFVGWKNGNNTYTTGQVLNWIDYKGQSQVTFTAVYEDANSISYYCDASNAEPTYIDSYAKDITNVELRNSGCVPYDSSQYKFYAWFTPFAEEETAQLKSYSFHTKHQDLWSIIEPTFVNHTSSYAESYDLVFVLTGLYAGYGVDTNDDGTKYLVELLQKHWYIVSTSQTMDISDNIVLYGFYYNYD